MVSGEPFFTRFEEQPFPAVQPMKRDVQFGRHAFRRFSPQNAVHGGIFLGAAEFQGAPVRRHTDSINGSAGGANTMRGNGTIPRLPLAGKA